MSVERQELWCHDCSRYVQFDLDMEQDGNYVLNCPNCGHEHCRVVRNGRITDIRWDSRNGPAISITAASTSVVSFYDTASTSSATTSTYLIQSWANTTSVG